MDKLEEFIKKHPWAVGGAVIGGFILLLLISRSGGSASSSTAALASQQIQGQTQLSAVQAQAGAQETAAALTAQAQVASVNAQANAQNTQNILGFAATAYNAKEQTSLGIDQTNQAAKVQEQSQALSAQVLNKQTAAQVTETQIAGNVQEQTNSTELSAVNDQLNAAEQINTNNNATVIQSQGISSNLAQAIAKIQASINLTQLGDQTTIATQMLNNQAANNQTILTEVGQAGLNHGTSSLESNLVSIIDGIEGNQSASVAAANAAGSEGVAASYSNASIWNTFINAMSKVANGLFAAG